MTHQLMSVSLLIFIFSLAAPMADAAQKKCPPGSYWSASDGKCIYGNGR
ncbi:hypothetical protein SAMN05444000_103161 [Shimia gijangensis]|uniref:Chitin binding Peritrophin-A domain-containing protein n=1 Tax=Shimia gijangensis TaxID=1470563 RepID=A0A1M6EAR5_9RHOB|nr:hypothetical protein [Shimia gijangensis]SHI82594.1 hypothetical protein SAMN05444000_103161 [Shimia gijangensis]